MGLCLCMGVLPFKLGATDWPEAHCVLKQLGQSLKSCNLGDWILNPREMTEGGLRTVPFSEGCSSTALMSHQSTPLPPTHTPRLPHPGLIYLLGTLQPLLISSPLNHFPSGEIFLEPFCGPLKADIRFASFLVLSTSMVWQELVPTVFVVLLWS